MLHASLEGACVCPFSKTPRLFNAACLLWVLCLVVTCQSNCMATVTQHTPATNTWQQAEVGGEHHRNVQAGEGGVNTCAVLA